MNPVATKATKRGHTILYSLNLLNTQIDKEKPSKVVLVTSTNIQSKLKDIFDRFFKNIPVIIIPDGEQAKDWQSIEKLLKDFLKLGLDRSKCYTYLPFPICNTITTVPQ